MSFRNRREAGRRLGAAVAERELADPVILGLPRGGVPVAAEVADMVGAPLDVLVVRKLGCPWQPELGIGGVGEGGVRVLNEQLIRQLGITEEQIEQVAADELVELERRVRRYRGDNAPVPLADRAVVVVDDGLATGFTARTAMEIARRHGAARVVLAVPVAPEDTVKELRAVADEIVCLETPPYFTAIGQWYADFRQTTDEEVAELLASNAAQRAAGEPGANPASSQEVEIPVDGLALPGTLTLPAGAEAVVVFAHGSGSSRHSPRNIAVAQTLQERGLGTLLFDLLEPSEELGREKVFDVRLLAERLAAVTKWLRDRSETETARVGYFGASTGAAAALWAAAELGEGVHAVVSRGGRPDLAAERLEQVTAPTLLIVGERDEPVVELNRSAAARLAARHELAIVPGAGHLFEERGALQKVAELAGEWLDTYLATDSGQDQR